MKRIERLISAAAAAAMIITCTSCSSDEKQPQEGFTPSLDAEKAVNIEIAGFFGNFEALDQVENDFNQLYPNVTFSYEQVGGDSLNEYIQNNPYVDIFMTSSSNILYPNDTAKYVADHCADLSALGLDLSDIQPEMLAMCRTDNGGLLRVPMSKDVCGFVVNVSLLEKEGLSVPTDYSEFMNTLETLKEKGYVPIQGPSSSVYADSILGMFTCTVGNDKELLGQVKNGDEAAVEKLVPIFERLGSVVNGYTDPETNDAYPADNYDQAILRFFDGEVPFWACNAEKVGGMKKRESKSETFSASPFEYKFIFPPTGDSGSYVYSEPWNGFSLNKDSDVYDYAAEFMRFLATSPELSKLANIKGVPPVTSDPGIEVYAEIQSPAKTEAAFTNDGSFDKKIMDALYSTAKQFALGEIPTAEEAAKLLLSKCAE